jgi:hypothetical protein
MKKLTLLMVLLSFALQNWAQETFKKEYKIPTKITLKGCDVIYLKKDSVVWYKNLTASEKQLLIDEYAKVRKVALAKEISFGDDKVTLTKDVNVDAAFYDGLSKTRTTNVTAPHYKIRGFVKFDENKVIVNPDLILNDTGYVNNSNYYFKLKNRQSISLAFSEWNVSALTLPLKYRLKGHNFSEEFSTNTNGNVFIGRSWGSTSFFHQDKVGNKSNTWKVTAGMLLGASSVTLNSSNTSTAAAPIIDDVEIIKGLGSLGLGFGFTFNKINLGTFLGVDYAVGRDAGKWNYNRKPWLGFAVGYSLLSF